MRRRFLLSHASVRLTIHRLGTTTNLLSWLRLTISTAQEPVLAAAKATRGPWYPASASGGRNEEVDFRGEKLSNQTHLSASDPDAMLYRKGSGMEARLGFIGHALMVSPAICVLPR